MDKTIIYYWIMLVDMDDIAINHQQPTIYIWIDSYIVTIIKHYLLLWIWIEK